MYRPPSGRMGWSGLGNASGANRFSPPRTAHGACLLLCATTASPEKEMTTMKRFPMITLLIALMAAAAAADENRVGLPAKIGFQSPISRA